MGVTLVTGASGFLGSHVLRALAERGDRLRALRRAATRTDHLTGIPCQWIEGDVLDRRSVRRALRGVDRVFHVAGVINMRWSAERLFELNVTGTRIVLEECLRAEVTRVVHTSSAAAIGPAKPQGTADETQLFTAGHLGIPYVNAKHEAEVEALRLAAQGLPIVIVCPAHLLGPGDHSRSSTDVVRAFMLRRIPAYTEGALNVVDVRDAARGMLLADEKGRIAERYILGDRNYLWERLFADIGRLSGVEPPAVRLGPAQVEALVATLAVLPGPKPITATELRAASQWWTYRSAKAKRELQWKPQIAHEECVEETVAWYREREGERLAQHGTRQPFALRAAGFALRQVDGAAGRVLGR